MPTIRTTAIMKPRRKRYFPPGQYDTEHAHELTPEQVEYGLAAQRCQRENNLSSLTFAQQHAVLISLGYRRTAAATALPKF